VEHGVADDSEIFLGVDIGGTKVAAGLVNKQGEILYKMRNPMNAEGTAEEALGAVCQAIDTTMRENPALKISGIGLSSPGAVDPYTGSVIKATNLPCWHDFPLATEVHKRYGLPSQLHNDANAAGLAEALWGAGVGYKCVFYATIGTGIGTAIVFNRRLYLGRTGGAGEGGHMSIDYDGERCRCGKPGCIETLAAGRGIAHRAQRKLVTAGARGKRLVALAGGDPSAITSEVIAKGWEEGDPFATEVLEETADLLAIWFGNLIDFLEPDVIVVGGGVSTLVARWFGRIRTQIVSWSVNPRCGEIPIFEAEYGPDSGIVGAAALCVAGDHITI
jgi:glucokinase